MPTYAENIFKSQDLNYFWRNLGIVYGYNILIFCSLLFCVVTKVCGDAIIYVGTMT